MRCRTLRRQKAIGAFSVKSYNQQRRDARQMIIKAARELQMMVVPEGGSLLYMNQTQILDGHTGVEHSLPVPRLYKDTVAAVREEQGRLHADADRRLRRSVGRVLLVSAHQRLGERAAAARSRRARSSTRARAAGRWRREDDFNHVLIAKGAKQVLDAGGIGAARRARPAAGARRALGAVDAAAGRHDADGGAARARRSTARATSASTARSARSRKASSRTSSSSTAIRSRTSATPSRSRW